MIGSSILPLWLWQSLTFNKETPCGRNCTLSQKKERFAKRDIMRTKEHNLQSSGNDTLHVLNPLALTTPQTAILWILHVRH